MTLSSVLNLNQSIDMTFRYMYSDFLKGNNEFFCKLLYKHTKQTLMIHVCVGVGQTFQLYQFSWDKNLHLHCSLQDQGLIDKTSINTSTIGVHVHTGLCVIGTI